MIDHNLKNGDGVLAQILALMTEDILNMPRKEPTNNHRSVGVISIAVDYDMMLPDDIMHSYLYKLRDEILKCCNKINIDDPRMTRKSLEGECRYLIRSFDVVEKDNDQNEDG